MQQNDTRYWFIEKMASIVALEVRNLADVYSVMLVF